MRFAITVLYTLPIRLTYTYTRQNVLRYILQQLIENSTTINSFIVYTYRTYIYTDRDNKTIEERVTPI